MCFEKDKFELLQKHKPDTVVIGNNSKLTIHGIGNIAINGRTVENVLYVPELRRNLLSVIQITK